MILFLRDFFSFYVTFAVTFPETIDVLFDGFNTDFVSLRFEKMTEPSLIFYPFFHWFTLDLFL